MRRESGRTRPAGTSRTLRDLARQWLTTLVVRIESDLDEGRKNYRRIREALAEIVVDPALSPVRSSFGLSKLPADEAAAWRTVWDDVRGLLIETE